MLNHIIIHGRLIANPEIRQTTSGVSVCNFTVAVDRSYNKGEDKQTDFFNVVAWRGLADLISKYFSKGKEIVIGGQMQSRKWVADDGNTRWNWEVLAESVDFCGSKATESTVENAPAEAPANLIAADFTDVTTNGDDLPF